MSAGLDLARLELVTDRTGRARLPDSAPHPVWPAAAARGWAAAPAPAPQAPAAARPHLSSREAQP